MKTYISGKEQLYLKWAWLILGLPIFIIGIADASRLYLFSHRTKDIIGVLMMILMTILFSYYSFAIRVLWVEDGKIVLQGFFEKIAYNLNEYQEVSKRWGAESYKIKFIDGESYRFIPKKGISNYFFLNFSKREKIDYLNFLLRETIEKHSKGGNTLNF